MKYEIHDKEPDFKPFSVTLTIETRQEAEKFEAIGNWDSLIPQELWQETRRRLGWSDCDELDGTYTCTITPKKK